MKIMLAYQFYQSRSAGATGQSLVNLYAEPNPEGSKYPYTIYNNPGSDEWCDLGTNKALQGMQKMGSLLYAVSGNEVFKVTEGGTPTSLGSITGTEGRVQMSNNGTQMSILNPDGDMWVATSSALAAVSDGDFPTASSTTFLDGYTIVSTDSTGQFNISDSYDSTAWDALDFETAEEAPDNLVASKGFNGALWQFGERSLETYYNSGNADFPFEQISGAVNTTRGCAARDSIIEADNGLFFLGDDRIFYRIEGYSPKRVSTHAVETAWNGYSIVSDCYGVYYEIDGHKFIVLTFPSADESWTLDLATGWWHKRTTLENGMSRKWRANCSEFFADKNLVGDDTNGKIYSLNASTYTEAGTYVERIIQGTVQEVEDRRVIYDSVFLDIDAGVGLTSGQGSDPQVMMRYSDDGLKTWSNERWLSFGRIGEYFIRPIWRRLGSARRRYFEWKITDPVKVRINGAYAKGRIGAE